MKDFLTGYFKDFKRNRGRRHRFTTLMCLLSLVVAVGVFWQLRIVGVTMTDEACCGKPEHVHTEECIAERRLICGMEETPVPDKCPLPEHIHDASCYEKQPVLVCGKEEHVHSEDCYEEHRELICTEDHEHTDACYKITSELICGKEEHTHSESCYEEQDVLICGMEEHIHDETCSPAPDPEAPTPHVHTEECYETVYSCGMEEHTHSLMCYSDPNADTETAEMWETTLPEGLSGVWSEDISAVAQSQLGYMESSDNFILAEDGETMKGYTRYGQWYGNPYGDWNTMFVSFCLNYAGVPEEVIKPASGAFALSSELEALGIYTEDESYIPVPGDIIFFKSAEHTVPDRAAIVYDVFTEAQGNTQITVIEGDADNRVSSVTYFDGNAEICGFAAMTGGKENTAPAELMAGPKAAAKNLQDMEKKGQGVTTNFVLSKDKKPITDGSTVESGKIYNFQVEIAASEGLKPGTYTYNLPAGVTTVATTGNLEIDGTLIGTYSINDKGDITFELNNKANGYSNLRFFAAGDLKFEKNAGNIDFDGKIQVVIKETHEKPKQVIKKSGAILKKDPNYQGERQIRWIVSLSSVATDGKGSPLPGVALVGQTITDTLAPGSSFTKSCQDRGLVFVAYEAQPDGTFTEYKWTAKAPEVTWGADGKSWSYVLPDTIKTDGKDGQTVKLDDTTMHYTINYRSEIDPEYVGKIKNTASVASETASDTVTYRGENPQNKIIKDGFYNAVTNQFQFTIDANIPAVTPSEDGKPYDEFAWHINDAVSVAGTAKLGLILNSDSLSMTIAEGSGAEISVPYCNNANGSDYCWAIGYPTAVKGNAIPKSVDIWLLHKCTCTNDNCSHRTGSGGSCVIPDLLSGNYHSPADQILPEGYCVCWHNTEPVHVKINYNLSKEDTAAIISAHAGQNKDLQNKAGLYHMLPKTNGYEAKEVAADTIKIPIPGIFNKDLITEPGNTNEYIASFKITVNEGKQVIVKPNESLVIDDTMSETLIYIKGSMSVTAEDENGTVRTLHPREYEISADPAAIGHRGIQITILKPEKAMYTLKYQAKLNTAGSSGSVEYSNTALVNLWGKPYEDGVTQIAMNVQVSGEQYVVTVTKHGVNADGPTLPGAVFGLYSQHNDQIANGTTDEAGQITFRTDVTAGIIFRKHEPYYLYELQAPAEYRADGLPHWFYFYDPRTNPSHDTPECKALESAHPGIVAIPTDVPGDIHITNLPAGGAELPATGGPGYFYYLPGIMLTASAAALGIKSKSRRHERRNRG